MANTSCSTRDRTRKRGQLALAIALAMAASDGGSMTITVNDSGDNGAPPGCTLRHAVSAINAASFGTDPCGSTGVGTFGTDDSNPNVTTDVGFKTGVVGTRNN